MFFVSLDSIITLRTTYCTYELSRFSRLEMNEWMSPIETVFSVTSLNDRHMFGAFEIDDK